jgi:concanavalin A-like lectin/glucanase superfamily protein/HYDIN/CFA65/VesB family protein/type IX secretion system substrate protein
MKAGKTLLYICLLSVVLATTGLGQSSCDTDKSCLGNALEFPGGLFDYVDVFTTPALLTIDQSDEMTVEMWLRVDRQPSLRQYIGGVWGPRTDRDDRWVLYIDETDSLVFELSNDSTNFAAFDNTVVKVPAIYGNWFHLAAMWDGATQEARIYIDGSLIATGRNAQYPVEELRPTISYLQFASYNGITNDPSRNANFTGTLDEIRLWNRIVPDDELRCNRYAALQGSEAGLILYFRCNENGGNVLCDASDFDGRGNRRGSAQFVPGSRSTPQNIFITPADFIFPMYCESDTTLTVSITDTSACGNRVRLQLVGQDRAAFSLNTTSLTLQQGVAQTVRVSASLSVTGQVSAAIRIIPDNGCSPVTDIPISILRTTQISQSMGHIDFDTLFGCVNKSFSDTTLTLCNATNSPQTISNFLIANPAFTVIPVGVTLPATMQPGQCIDVIVRFSPSDTGLFTDTLFIASTDSCPGSGRIPVSGRNIDIVVSTIDFADFDTQPLPCRMSVNLAEEFFIRSRVNDNFVIEAFESTNSVFSSSTTVPITVRPGRAYRANLRFRSSVQGFYQDTIRMRISYRGCTIYKNFPVQGSVIGVALETSDTLVNFGIVRVGQSTSRTITLRNIGIDARQVFAYLSSGRVFSFNGSSTIGLTPGDSTSITINFRPLEARNYRDTICFQDVRCLVQVCVILEGTGEFGTLEFTPSYVLAEDVINCQCTRDTIVARNISGAQLTINSVTIQGSGNFSFVPGPPPANDILAPDETRSYIIEYCPNGAPDFLTETADLVFNTDGPDGILRIQLRGTNIEPKLFVSQLTNYGDVEVGTTTTRQILITNVSPTPVTVNSIGGLPPGYTVLSAVPPIGSTLQFRDTMIVTLEFAPTNNITYTGRITATSNFPCNISADGEITGRGIIVPLFVPWTTIVFSEATRCDSVIRVVGLVNDGSVPITIDSIWIVGPDAQAFTWQGQTFNGILPHDVAAKFADSINIIYKPINSPNVISFAQIYIAATNRLGQQVFVINLSGSRIEQFIPSANFISFAPTPVNQFAGPQTLTIMNPSYIDTLIIDSLSFEPDQGVFGWVGVLPAIVLPRESVSFDIDFRPRAALDYTARLRMVNRQPCAEVDTSITVFGSGYTPPYLVVLCIDPPLEARIGDELLIPVLLNRNIPQNPVDIDIFIEHYPLGLKFLGAQAVFTTIPVLDTARVNGTKLSVRGNQNVTAGPFMYIRFKVLLSDQTNLFVRSDSVTFASDSTFFIALFGDGCFTTMNVNGHCSINRVSFSAFNYELYQNYPNPFTGQTTIEFENVEDTNVRIDIRDMSGRIVAVLTDTYYVNGRYALTFTPGALPSGNYIYTMQTANFNASRRMTIAK